MAYQSLSFFSGAGGLDIGLEQAGIEFALSQDFDAHCGATQIVNHRKILLGDIRNISSDDILYQSGLAKSEPFLISGGPPCQPFSTAGLRLGINDPRGSLFMDFARMIDEIRPRFFVMENVKGMLSSKLKNPDGSNSETCVLDIILEQFGRLHYKLVYGVLNAVDYGAPQFRERLIILGSRDNENIFLPQPCKFQMHQDLDLQWLVLRQVIQDLELDPGECASFSPNRSKYLDLIPPGGNWRDLPASLIPEAMGGAYLSGGGKSGFYRRLNYNEPAPTLTTSPVQKATMLCHPVQTRPLSVREYARIQQFPDDWVFAGSVQAKYKQIGNAVPVSLGRAIGQALLATANNNYIISAKRVR